MKKNRIIQGDALQVLRTLPNDAVDVGVTSPPYNKQEKNKGWLVKNVVYSHYRDKLPEPEYQDRQAQVLNAVYRTIKPGGSFFYNHKIRWDNGELFHPMDWLRKTDWVIKQEIIWDRVLAGNIRGWRFWQVEERVYWLYKPVAGNKKGKELASMDAKLTSIWRAVPENKNPHPAPFPLWLPARVILSILRDKKRGLVLDPYMGSGTTAVAARLLGHDYLGIEIDKGYIEHAENRIKHAHNESDVLWREQELHKVEETSKSRKKSGKNVGKFQEDSRQGLLLR